METISELESAIRFCDKKVLEFSKQETSEKEKSDPYIKSRESRLMWLKKKHELERLMEQRVMAIPGIEKSSTPNTDDY